ncbi:uncharacterized protein LOC134813895 isoform X1 [Bolinopsis microptera]|uniref:uncharacterized protein LOC134813895 isoform X1 n=1 Tax=Bolinopsis microptera TaxID=2820187 RepID=UPI003078DE81
MRSSSRTIKQELYDPLSPTRSPDEFSWRTLSESISSFRAKSDKENRLKELKKEYREVKSHREARSSEGKEYKREFGSYGGKGYDKELRGCGGFKTEVREQNSTFREVNNEYKEFNKSCSSFRTYDPLDDVSYFYEPKRAALKSNFASQLEQYFILDTPFTLTKSIEEDYPVPSNEFLVPPKWDLYADLFVEQAAEAHNWNFFERKMIAITDARLLKAQNAIVRVSGPLIRTLGTKVSERNCSYHAIWISIGYAFWFLSRVRRQLLLEAVLGTRDRKRIDRYLSDANKMSMFWPDNSDLLGKKFFDHIVQSERRQEEFRDVLMKDVRRSSDQRIRNQIIRPPSGNNSHYDQSSSFGNRRLVARSSSHEVRSFGEDRGMRHSEVSTPIERINSKHSDIISPSDQRPLQNTEVSNPIDRRSSRHAHDRSSKHSEVRTQDEDRSSKHSEVRTHGEDRSSKHSEVRTLVEDRSSKNSEVRTHGEDRSSKHSEVRTHGEDRSSKHSEVRTLVEDRSSKHSEVRTHGEDRSSKHSEVRTHGEDRSSKYAETRTPCEERGSKYAEAKSSSLHGYRRQSGNRVPCFYGDVQNSEVSFPSYKGIPLTPEVITSNCKSKEGAPSRKIGSEDEGQNKGSYLCRQSSKRRYRTSGVDRTIIERSCKRKEIILEKSVSLEGNISEAISKREDSPMKGVENESDEEEGEIRDISLKFSLKKKEDSALSSKNGFKESENKDGLTHITSKETERSPHSNCNSKENGAKRNENISKTSLEINTDICKSSSEIKYNICKSSSTTNEDIYKLCSESKEFISKSSCKKNEGISESSLKKTSSEREERVPEPSSERKERVPESSSKREEKVPESSSKREEKVPESSSKREEKVPESSSKREEKVPESSLEREEKVPESSSEREERVPESSSERKERVPEPSTSSPDKTGNFYNSPLKRRCEEREERDPSFKKQRVLTSYENRCQCSAMFVLSSSSHEELVKQKTEELAAQFDKNIKIEVELSFLKDTNKKLNDVNKELEDNLQSNQEQLEKKLSLICDLQRELDQVRNELDQVEKERSTFQTLASEKDTRISNLKSDNEAFKLKERGWNMEKKKLATQIEELQAQAASQSKLLTEREDSLKKIQRDIDLLNSDQTVNEQHRQQLTNLRQEIEQRKDKEKMFELEKLRLDKDKLVQEIETKAKLRHGEMERTLDQVQDLNSKLEANLVVLQNKQDSQTKEVEEERETTAMFKAEAERDIKLQKQNAAMELEELKEQAGRREAAFQERILALQTEIQNRPSGSGVNTGDTATDPAAPSPSPDQLAPSQLAVQLRDQAREIESLRTARARSLQIAVTQFQKGDTVFFYYDETKSNYLVANVSPNEYQYFLHPDNLGALGLSLDPPGRKPWAIGVIKDKEFCQARKVNNRFKVPEGRKFYRVYAQPRDSNNAPSNAPSNSARNPD